MLANISNGFHSEVYKKGNDIIIVFRGTDIEKGVKERAKDMLSIAQMGARYLPNQMKNARRVYNEYYRIYPKANIIKLIYSNLYFISAFLRIQ